MYSHDDDLFLHPEQQFDTDFDYTHTDHGQYYDVHDSTDDMNNDTHGDADHDPDVHIDEPKFGGYSGSYSGINNCWYSSDGYVYDAAGNCVGTH
ncbi:MAG: hypothetical protein ICV53_22645 [Flavisolibacter sp.]|nr:hypothetical protein [Flavisolibacter sp.]